MHLDLLHPDTVSKVADKREKSIPWKQARKFAVGQKLYAKTFQGSNWLPVDVVKITGPLSYQVQTSEGLILKRQWIIYEFSIQTTLMILRILRMKA